MFNKKALIVALVTILPLGLASASNVEIYGTMHYAWDIVDTNDTAGDSSDDATGVNHASLLGVSVSEDLGDGLKAIVTVETDVGGTFGSNNTFVGLDGGFGTVILGQLDTPYKTATIDWNMWADTVGDYNAIIGSDATGASNFEVLAPQTAAYVSPDINGMQFAVARIAIKNSAAGNDDEAWSMSATYSNGPLGLAAAYETHSGPNLGLGSTATADEDAWKIGAIYTLGDGTVSAVYEDIDHDDKTTRQSRKAWWLGYSHEFGNNMLGVTYAQADDSDLAGADDGADQVTLGLTHSFSPRTSVYALYSRVSNDSQGSWGLNGAGLYAASGPGRDVSALSFGLVHEF